MKTISDPAKAAANRRAHGVTFAEAGSVFGDPLAYDTPDGRFQNRMIIIGRSDRGRLLYVVHELVSDDLTRLISARLATRHERKDYEEEG